MIFAIENIARIFFFLAIHTTLVLMLNQKLCMPKRAMEDAY